MFSDKTESKIPAVVAVFATRFSPAGSLCRSSYVLAKMNTSTAQELQEEAED